MRTRSKSRKKTRFTKQKKVAAKRATRVVRPARRRAATNPGRIYARLSRLSIPKSEGDQQVESLLDEPPTRLRLAYGIEDDQAMPPLVMPIEAPGSGVAQAARERREIMISYPAGRFPPIPGTRPMATALFGPLIVNDELFGVLTVQSERVDAYGERERLAFTSLCAYGATALANAQAHRELTRANTELDRIATTATEHDRNP